MQEGVVGNGGSKITVPSSSLSLPLLPLERRGNATFDRVPAYGTYQSYAFYVIALHTDCGPLLGRL